MKRLNWIDALRGLTMVSVVLVHVLTFSFGLDPTKSVLAQLRASFTLPLFFFVSGFFLYRPLDAWDGRRVRSALKVRTIAMVLGTIVFSTAYFAMRHGKHALQWLPDGNFGEYWYTFSLYQIFIWYMLAIAISKLCRSEKLLWAIMTAVFIGCWVQNYVDVGHYWCYWWANKKTAIYFQYFLLGMIGRKFQSRFFDFIAKPRMLTALLIAYPLSLGMLLMADKMAISIAAEIVSLLRRFITPLLGVMLVLNIFYSHRDFFDKETRFVRGWRFIGQRTLDIYFLHYFLLPQMYWMRPYMTKNNTLLTELVCGLIVAAAVLTVVLGISKILREAPLIRNLLGAKDPLPKRDEDNEVQDNKPPTEYVK